MGDAFDGGKDLPGTAKDASTIALKSHVTQVARVSSNLELNNYFARVERKTNFYNYKGYVVLSQAVLSRIYALH
jgi:hypothetical protein